MMLMENVPYVLANHTFISRKQCTSWVFVIEDITQDCATIAKYNIEKLPKETT